ncbi:hypothetical protein N657DRAFT_195230 [Parathielavia appendiculata]|uniref:Uncharacterized protein n=1 Tax=Parathielavia appendiculata TaxID=2587402 RepID=A0AAN6U782_9PEZI|nr:hypothetical protein N657DRAFT_195230 [Parathielavia appendiculata]
MDKWLTSNPTRKLRLLRPFLRRLNLTLTTVHLPFRLLRPPFRLLPSTQTAIRSQPVFLRTSRLLPREWSTFFAAPQPPAKLFGSSPPQGTHAQACMPQDGDAQVPPFPATCKRHSAAPPLEDRSESPPGAPKKKNTSVPESARHAGTAAAVSVVGKTNITWTRQATWAVARRETEQEEDRAEDGSKGVLAATSLLLVQDKDGAFGGWGCGQGNGCQGRRVVSGGSELLFGFSF